MTDGRAEVRLDPGRGLVTVRDRRLTVASDACLFVARAFACPAVMGVHCDVRTGQVTIELDAAGPRFSAAVSELSYAVRSGQSVTLPMDAVASRQFTLRRVGRRLTTWNVGSDAADRLRFRHPRLRRDRVLARRIERLIVTLPGVHDVRLSGWKSDLVVHVDIRQCDGDALLGLLQRAVDERATAESGTSAWQMAGKSGTLALLAATDLVFPALAPVSALLLVGTNLRTIGGALGDVRRLRLGPAVVATAIIFGTLATGQFLAAGIMAWSFEFWRRRHHRDIEAERMILLEDAVPVSPRLTQGDHSTESLVTPAQRLRFSSWEVVSADGVVVSGGGVIDERCLTGVAGGRPVAVGDRIAAGSVVLGGAVDLAIEHHQTEETRAASVLRLLAAATELRPGRFTPTIDGDKLVSQFAGPTLATAGLGLLAGDVTTAVAILRPDYGSAEAMSLSFEDLDAMACGLSAGCLLTGPRVLDELHAIDTLLIIGHSALHEPEVEVARIIPPARDKATEDEIIRLAASMARHLADPRREALARLATDRGCYLTDMVPDSFGDERGLRIVCHRGQTRVALAEGQALTKASRPLILEVNGVCHATFEFSPGTKSRAARGLEQIQECRPLHVIVAGSPEANGDLPRTEQVDGEHEAVRDRLESLRRAGRKVALVGLPETVSEFAAEADVTIALGLSADPSVSVAGVICLSGDLASLGGLLAAAADRRGRLATSRRLSIIPNAVCVAGAFLFGFTSVIAAVVTNLGTLGIYRRASGGLRRRRRLHWLRQRAMLPRLEGRSRSHDLPRAS